MPPQIQRLILVTLGIVGVYFVAHSALTPASFGEFGWYRGAALGEAASLPPAYAGKTACADCHADLIEKMGKSKHKEIPCQSCHGASYEHTENPAVSPPKIVDPRFCLRCHLANPARPAKFPQVDAAEHFGDQKCSECHQPHAPKEAPTK